MSKKDRQNQQQPEKKQEQPSVEKAGSLDAINNAMAEKLGLTAADRDKMRAEREVEPSDASAEKAETAADVVREAHSRNEEVARRAYSSDIRETISIEALDAVSDRALPGESMGTAILRLLGERDGLHAMLGSDATGRGLFVKYEDGPGYSKGGSYSLHRIVADAETGTVQVTVQKNMGRVVEGKLRAESVGPWHQLREDLEQNLRTFVTPEDYR